MGLLNKISYSNQNKIRTELKLIFSKQLKISKSFNQQQFSTFVDDFAAALWKNAVLDPKFRSVYASLCEFVTHLIPKTDADNGFHHRLVVLCQNNFQQNFLAYFDGDFKNQNGNVSPNQPEDSHWKVAIERKLQSYKEKVSH
ncbi:hypothetical protein P9112_010486 [Eukaryota sp. TZLM1-RC]